MNDRTKTEQAYQPVKEIPPAKTKSDQPPVTESKSPGQQTVNRMPARAESLFTMGKRHV